jgi:outer membrane protein OmpA-like peptidoglycan-associated protein
LAALGFAQPAPGSASNQESDAFAGVGLGSPGEATLRVSNIFQDGSGALSDIVMFYPSVPAGAASWEVTVLDSSDRTVQRFTAAGACPRAIAWFGVGSDGAVVRDGFYRARLSSEFTGGKRSESREESFSFMTPPEIAPLAGLPLALREDDSKIVVSLPDLLFAVGRADFAGRAPDTLDAVSGFLKAHPGRPIFILGHTDDTGSPQHNLRLSEQRALAVYSFLLSRGLSPQRLRYRGLGSSRPAADNSTAAGRARNRRVEIWLSKNRSIPG